MGTQFSLQRFILQMAGTLGKKNVPSVPYSVQTAGRKAHSAA